MILIRFYTLHLKSSIFLLLIFSEKLSPSFLMAFILVFYLFNIFLSVLAIVFSWSFYLFSCNFFFISIISIFSLFYYLLGLLAYSLMQPNIPTVFTFSYTFHIKCFNTILRYFLSFYISFVFMIGLGTETIVVAAVSLATEILSSATVRPQTLNR